VLGFRRAFKARSGTSLEFEIPDGWVGLSARCNQTDSCDRRHPGDRAIKLRDELLNGELFYTLREAQVLIEWWRVHYNTFRPHSALGYRPPAPETVQWPSWLRDEKLLLALT